MCSGNTRAHTQQNGHPWITVLGFAPLYDRGTEQPDTEVDAYTILR